jgi:glutamyl-tRNA synthetase
MGWSYDDHTEFFSMQDLIEKFDPERFNPAPAAINFSKLDHFNGLHIRSLSNEDLAKRVKPFFERADIQVKDDLLLQIVSIIQERIGTLDEAVEMAGFFFQEDVEPYAKDLVIKGLDPVQSADVARRCLQVLSNLPELTLASAEEPLRELAEELGLSAGQVFGLIRVAVTGQKVSPPLFESMEIIGREKVIDRLQKAMSKLEQM